MKAAEWINLISNERDKKFARAACTEVLEEASDRELLCELARRRPCARCEYPRDAGGACIQPCRWQPVCAKNSFKEGKL